MLINDWRKTQRSKSIIDLEVLKVLQNVNIVNISSDYSIFFDQEKFKQTYDKWIHSSNLFKIKGLDTFPHYYVTHGITESFHDVYSPNSVVLKDEYVYHQQLGIPVVDSYKDIKPSQRLIISYPFSGTGKVHPDWDNIITSCNSIFIDCCLFGVSSVRLLDVTAPNISHVAFSFSKTFGTGGCRTGLLYKRLINRTSIEILNKHHYTQMAGQIIHYNLMKNFSPDYMFNKYRQKQLNVCKTEGIVPSDTVIYGILDQTRISLAYKLQKFKKNLNE